ncbi:GGDEF domain-containing protein [Brevibacillus sp. NRS-1366]|uniref:GGDEF domain-containing protein n=1 Tax=Brevibacillus sp. NRS-1366 TaxID=3233899 RepID=UPI003D1CC743
MNIAKKLVHIPANISPSDHRFFVFCNSMFLFAFFAHIIFVPLFYKMGDTIVFINNILAIFLDLLCLRLNYRGFLKTATALWIFEISAHTLYCTYAYGWEQGYYYYFLSLVIIVFYSRWAILLRLLVTAFLCTATILMFDYTHTYPPVNKLNYSTLNLIHAFNAVANFVGIAYASYYYRRYSEQMEARLLHLASTDPLTGICNRRFFEQSVDNKLEQTSRDGIKECALLLLDIDHFKKINDSFGHAVGDLALQKVAEVCSQSLRKGDVLGRIGGEEFAIFFDNVDHSEVLQFAEQLRRNIEDCKLLIDEATELGFSVSIGIAVPKFHHEKLSSIMVRSDQALYQAKNSGRNKVVALI